jgi:hypothetical protein
MLVWKNLREAGGVFGLAYRIAVAPSTIELSHWEAAAEMLIRKGLASL